MSASGFYITNVVSRSCRFLPAWLGAAVLALSSGLAGVARADEVIE